VTDLLAALGLALALEGTIYALAPGAMKRAIRQMLDLPDQTLRIAGLTVLATGVCLVWFVRG
tara:strand:- start:1679 stop:1864 length:186 start_codon:yes stop_codon:yes gene_type:complete